MMMKVAILLLALVAVVVLADPQDINANLPKDLQTQQAKTAEKLESTKKNVQSLRATLTATNTRLAAAEAAAAALETDLNILWVVVTVVLKIFLVFGITLIEASAARRASLAQVLTKNVALVCIVAFAWWAWGYGAAYAIYEKNDTDNPFIGNGRVFLANNGERTQLEFGLWAASYTTALFATLIATSTLTDRGSLVGYSVLGFVFASFIYPVAVHWVWANNGWLNVLNDAGNLGNNGMIDWSGSGVVALTGATVALIATVVAGPRMRRFDDDFNAANPARYGAINKVYLGLGVMTLWIGAYGLTCGVSMVAGGAAMLVVKVAVNTTLAAGAGSIIAFMFDALLGAPVVDMTYVSAHPEDTNPPKSKRTDMRAALNGVVAGLVAVLAGMGVYEPWAAVVVGAVGGALAVLGPIAISKARIDDPADMVSIFGLSGFIGLTAVGWFARKDNITAAYNNGVEKNEGIWYDGDAEQWGVQIFGGFCLFCWALVMGAIVVVVLNAVGVLKVSEAQEAWGLDSDVPAEDEEEEMVSH
eukprot:PhM_4_TR8182/c0_g1_i1/m.29230/K03320/amt, AMT, MEP; ammonium transporter, Amt family